MAGTSAGLDDPLAPELLTFALMLGEPPPAAAATPRKTGDSRKGAEECCSGWGRCAASPLRRGEAVAARTGEGAAAAAFAAAAAAAAAAALFAPRCPRVAMVVVVDGGVGGTLFVAPRDEAARVPRPLVRAGEASTSLAGTAAAAAATAPAAPFFPLSDGDDGTANACTAAGGTPFILGLPNGPELEPISGEGGGGP